MSNIRILHNPRCSKSRQTLELLKQNGIEPEVVEYQKAVPSIDELKGIAAQLGLDDVRNMMRTKEDEYKQQGLNDSHVTQTQLIAAMHSTPKLIERPIVISSKGARIGRPPESVLEII